MSSDELESIYSVEELELIHVLMMLGAQGSSLGFDQFERDRGDGIFRSYDPVWIAMKVPKPHRSRPRRCRKKKTSQPRLSITYKARTKRKQNWTQLVSKVKDNKYI